MRRKRVHVLGIANFAALGAAWLARAIISRPREGQQGEKTVGATDVLVAAKDFKLGDSVSADDMKWQQWPIDGVTLSLVTKDARANAPTDLAGSIARSLFIAGEPIKEQKLIKVRDGRLMAAILPASMRAVSTPITEESSAGGFILPNGRVDVLLTHKIEVGSREQPLRRTCRIQISAARVSATSPCPSATPATLSVRAPRPRVAASVATSYGASMSGANGSKWTPVDQPLPERAPASEIAPTGPN